MQLSNVATMPLTEAFIDNIQHNYLVVDKERHLHLGITMLHFWSVVNQNHQFPRKNTISTISTNEIHNALLETTALLFLISDSLSSYEALPTDGRNWYIHGNGLEITVRKDKYSKFVVTGYSNDLFSDKTNTEAAETINAVIAKYGYTQEFLDLYTLVGAELASIYPNIALQIKSVNLYYKKHNKYIPDISINQLNEPIITKNNILISKNISSFQNNNTDILEIIGNLIDTDKTGKLTLESYKTLAQAMNIYSDKRYETARYLFVKDGQIIRHLTVSTQTPSSTIIKPDDSFLYNLKNYAEQTDSKSITMLHFWSVVNHKA